jgi:hypothetical protein
MIKVSGVPVYLDYKTVVTETRLRGTASIIKEMSGNATSRIESTRCTNQAIFYSRIMSALLVKKFF